MLLLPFIAHAPALNGAFLWDDSAWTDDIERLTRDVGGLWRMWSDPTALQQYFPLTGTTFWLDRQMWDARPLPLHVENVLLHAASALLLWRVLLRLGLGLAWPAALLFAVHPMMTESVAWIAERKNVLAMTLMLAAALCWLRGGRMSSFVLFLAALLAKITAFVLPPALILIAWWREGDIRWRRDVRPLVPHFIAAFVLGLVVLWVEAHVVKAQGADFEATAARRAFIAGHAPWFYLSKLLWPLDLCSVYPVRWESWLPPLGTLVVPAALFAMTRRLGRGPAAGTAFFLIALFPVLGFLNVYGMLFSPVADRWAYTASLAFFAGLATLPKNLRWLLLAAVPVLMPLTRERARLHQNLTAYWQDVLAKNPESWIARHGFGLALSKSGDAKGAIVQFRRALEQRPQYDKGWVNLGNALLASGAPGEALDCLRHAVEINPALPGAHYNLGNCHLALGDLPQAVAAYEQEIALGGVTNAHNNLGALLLQTGRVSEALPHLQAVVDDVPRRAGGHANLGLALSMSGRAAEAVRSWETALRLDPAHPAALSNLAWVLATHPDDSMRDGRRAVELAQRAGDSAQALRSLAAALAETGRFEEARTTLARAIEKAANSPLAAEMAEEARSYAQNRPFRQR